MENDFLNAMRAAMSNGGPHPRIVRNGLAQISQACKRSIKKSADVRIGEVKKVMRNERVRDPKFWGPNAEDRQVAYDNMDRHVALAESVLEATSITKIAASIAEASLWSDNPKHRTTNWGHKLVQFAMLDRIWELGTVISAKEKKAAKTEKRAREVTDDFSSTKRARADCKD